MRALPVSPTNAMRNWIFSTLKLRLHQSEKPD
jgi:hypothetical protein